MPLGSAPRVPDSLSAFRKTLAWENLHAKCKTKCTWHETTLVPRRTIALDIELRMRNYGHVMKNITSRNDKKAARDQKKVDALNKSAELEAMPITPLTVANLENSHGLKPADAKRGAALQAKFPEVVQAVDDIARQETLLGDKYFELCSRLRAAKIEVNAEPTATGDEPKTTKRNLSRDEVKVLLRSLGYAKSRVSEINRVIEVSDAIWAQYANRSLTYRSTLAIARGKDEKPALLTDEEKQELEKLDQEPKSEKNAKPALHLPEVVEKMLLEVLSDKSMANVKPTTNDDHGYVLKYMDATGWKFTLTLFVDAK